MLGHGYTFSVNPLRLIVGALEARGLSADEVLATQGIKRAQLDDIEERVPFDAARRLLEEAGRALGDPDIGLLLCRQGPLGHGVIMYAARASSTLGEAYQTVCRLHRLVTDVGRMDLEVDETRARLVIDTTDTPPLSRHLAEWILGVIVRGGRQLTGVQWNPSAVRFRHQAPARIDGHRTLFAAPVFFGQTRDEFEIDRKLLALPLTTAEPVLARIMDRYGREILSRLPPTNDFTVAVRQVVTSSLANGEPTLDGLAERFHLTPRTLQRRLSSEGLTLRALIDDARRQLALQHIERRELTLAEIAYLLGFDAVTSFHRAFRRWTGVTPAHYRQRLTHQPPITHQTK